MEKIIHAREYKGWKKYPLQQINRVEWSNKFRLAQPQSNIIQTESKSDILE